MCALAVPYGHQTVSTPTRFVVESEVRRGGEPIVRAARGGKRWKRGERGVVVVGVGRKRCDVVQRAVSITTGRSRLPQFTSPPYPAAAPSVPLTSMPSSQTASSNNTIKVKKKKAITDALLESFASLLRREPTSLSASQSTDDLLSKITIQDIRKSKKVGSGGFGDVLLVEHPWIGKVALKRLQLSRCSADAEDQRRVRLDT